MEFANTSKILNVDRCLATYLIRQEDNKLSNIFWRPSVTPVGLNSSTLPYAAVMGLGKKYISVHFKF